MSRNAIDRISQMPATKIERTKMSRSSGYKTSINSGVLIPFYVDDGILPGDTVSMDVSALIRQSTALAHPVMDNAYADIYWFGVPWRLLWDHAEEFHGATDKAWNTDASLSTGFADGEEYSIPTIPVPEGGFKLGSIADYMGIPTYTGNGEHVNALPFRAYLKAWNDYFRDGNLMDEVQLNTGDDGTIDAEGIELSAATNYRPLPVCKYHDLFTSALPYPQRGEPATIPAFNGVLPVYSQGSPNAVYANGPTTGNNAHPIQFNWLGSWSSPEADPNGYHHLYASYTGVQDGVGRGKLVADDLSDGTGVPNRSVAINNLVADTAYASAVTINQLRLAIQMQEIMEADARGGTRYTSLIRQHFGVISPDGRLQRAEYLGGKRIPLNRQEIAQTSSSVTGSALGDLGATSKTVDEHYCFEKSFTEHTVLIGVMCIRVDQSYQQGLDRMWSKRTRFDYYLPKLAHIGEVGVLNKEIYWQDASAVDELGNKANDAAFGYQEPWYEYRYRPNKVTGYLRSNANAGDSNRRDANGNILAGSLDSWHYGAVYDSLPHLSKDWIVENPAVVDRTLAVTSELSQQFLVDLWFNEVDTRPMPLYSIPGFGGHF